MDSSFWTKGHFQRQLECVQDLKDSLDKAPLFDAEAFFTERQMKFVAFPRMWSRRRDQDKRSYEQAILPIIKGFVKGVQPHMAGKDEKYLSQELTKFAERQDSVVKKFLLKDCRRRLVKELFTWKADAADFSTISKALTDLETFLKRMVSSKKILGDLRKGLTLESKFKPETLIREGRGVVSFAQELRKANFRWQGLEAATVRSLAREAVKRAETLNSLFGRDVVDELIELPFDTVTLDGFNIDCYYHDSQAKEALYKAERDIEHHGNNAALGRELAVWKKALKFLVLMENLDHFATSYCSRFVSLQRNPIALKMGAKALVNKELVPLMITELNPALEVEKILDIPGAGFSLENGVARRTFAFTYGKNSLSLKTRAQCCLETPQGKKHVFVEGMHQKPPGGSVYNVSVKVRA